MNSISIVWDSTKWAERPYFHCDPSVQNENEGKGELGKQNKTKNPEKTTT